MQIVNYQHNEQRQNAFLESKTFRYGEGFFTTTAIRRFVPLWLERHIQRLNDSMVDFEMGEISADELSPVVYKWIQENQLEQGFLRIMTWNEAGQVKVYINGGGLNDGGNQPVSLMICPYYRHSSQPLLAYKNFNYWINNLAYKEGLKQGYDEIVFLNEKEEICEGSRCNIFWVNEGMIYTPHSSCGLLPGICREKVLGIAYGLGLEVNTGAFHLSEIEKAQEIFLTNSVLGIRGVSYFRSGHNFKGGLITGLVSKAYDTLVDNYVKT